MFDMFRFVSALQKAADFSDRPLRWYSGDDGIPYVVDAKDTPGFRPIAIIGLGKEMTAMLHEANEKGYVYFSGDKSFFLSRKGIHLKRTIVYYALQILIFSILLPCLVAFLTARCSVL